MQPAPAAMSEGEARSSYWVVTIQSSRDGYRSVFGEAPHLQIHSNGLPLPSPLSPATIDAFRAQGVPEQAVAGGTLDIEELVRGGWNVSSVLPEGPHTSAED